LFMLSIWQGNLSLKQFYPGVPRGLERAIRSDGNEAGVPKYNRNMRIAAFSVSLGALMLIALVVYLRLAPKVRKGAYFGLAIILLAGGVLAWIAFGLDINNGSDAIKCRARELGTLEPTHTAFSSEHCRNFEKMLVATTVIDAALAFFACLTALVLMFAAIKSGKALPADDFEGAFEGPRRSGVSKTLRQILVILLILTFAFGIILFVFTILDHEARDVFDLDEVLATRQHTTLRPGWPEKNTRLRLTASVAAVIILLVNLIPFRSRIVAYVFAFLIICVSVLALMAFSLDTKSVDSARDLTCPEDWDCKYHPYLATCFFDIILGVGLLLYVLFEYVYRVAKDATHASKIYY